MNVGTCILQNVTLPYNIRYCNRLGLLVDLEFWQSRAGKEWKWLVQAKLVRTLGSSFPIYAAQIFHIVVVHVWMLRVVSFTSFLHVNSFLKNKF